MPFDFARSFSSASNSAFSRSSNFVRCSRRSTVKDVAFELIAAIRAARSSAPSAGRDAPGGGGGGLIRVRLGGPGSARRGLRLELRLRFLPS